MITPILLQTKFLVPHRTSGHLPRPHLVERIRHRLDERLILLIAPPGYGKTMLATEVVADIDKGVDFGGFCTGLNAMIGHDHGVAIGFQPVPAALR